MLARGIEAEGRTVDGAKLDQMFKDFIVYYADNVAVHSRPFPGLIEALDTLSARGFRLAVCTNKLEHLSVLLLNELKLTHRFVAICGQDTFGIQKPDPEVLRRTITAAGGDIDRAIMVGDSETDILTARAAGIPVIAVDFGYSDRPVSGILARQNHQPLRAIAGNGRIDPVRPLAAATIMVNAVRLTARGWLPLR